MTSSPASIETQRSHKIFWTMAVVGALTTLIFVIWVVTSVGGMRTTAEFSEIGEGVAGLAGGVMCLLGSRHAEGRAKTAWRFFAAGCLLWTAGEGAWCWYDIGANTLVPFPGFADLGFLGEVPLFVVGTLLFPSARGNEPLSRWRFTLDGVIIGGSILAISWGAVLGAAYHAGGGSPFSQTIALAYPISDVLVATVAFSMLGRIDRQYRVSAGLLISALVLISMADSTYLSLTQTANYANLHLVDGGWVAGFLALGVASLRSHEPRRAEGHGRPLLSNWQVILPYFFLGSAGAFIVAKYFVDRHLDAFLVTDGLGLIAVVLVRQVVTLLEDTKLTRSLEHQTRMLEHQTRTDPLTAVGNRLMFADRVQKIVAGSDVTGANLGILICDLDNFKYVNDKLGHAAGDALLIEVAQRLVDTVRRNDLVVRLGGDEFAIVLEPTTTSDQAVEVAIGIIEAMQASTEIGSEPYPARMSIGIAIESLTQATSGGVMRNADVALYSAKDAGGNCYQLFEPSMGDEHFDRLNLETDLSTALQDRQFEIEYQPIVHLSSGQTIGAEALIRWDHPQRGRLQPNEFLGLAESTGAIISMGYWVLEQALNQLREWRRLIPEASELWMAVNLSALQLESHEFTTSVASVLERTRTDPDSLHLELTETEIALRDDSSIEQLSSLRSLGIQLAIDDFGTGYSSLSYLKQLPVNTLKIDRSFVSEIDSNTFDELIVRSVISLAEARGLEVIAEGIETSSQLERLKAMGCSVGQGFYWAPAMSAFEFGAWLKSQPEIASGTTPGHTVPSTLHRG